jgi:hypothetical protein
MTQALGRVMSAVRELTDQTEMGLDDSSVCFGGALIRVGQESSTGVPLQEGRTYGFVGGGDNDAQDVDIVLRDPDGKVVAQDTDTDASPAFEFSCRRTGQYRIFLRMAKSKDDASFGAFALLRKGGFDVPTKNLTVAASNCLRLCESAHENGSGAIFHQGAGEWAILGTILKEGEELTHRGVAFRDGRHAVLAAADANAKDLDLTVIGPNDKVVGKDADTDPNPVVLFTGAGTIQFKLSNRKSTGATLAFVSLLELDQKK